MDHEAAFNKLTNLNQLAKVLNLGEQVKQGVLYAMRLLSIAKRSELDLKLKLKHKGYPEEAIQQVIHLLKEKKLLNDLEFAKHKVYWSQYGNPVGRNRIRLELRKKGLSEDNISEALQEWDPSSEKEKALLLAKTRFDKLKTLDPTKRKKRIYDFLVRRGFAYEISREVISELERTQ